MQFGGNWSVWSRSYPLLSRLLPVFRPFKPVMKMRTFSFSSHLKSTENLWKIDNFLFARFLLSPFPALFYPLTSPFYASKKDLKHFCTLSPYSSLFLPAIFRGIFRRFWWGGNQSLSSSHLKPTENPRKTSDFLRVPVKRLAENVVIVAIYEAKWESQNNANWRKSIRSKPFKSVISCLFSVFRPFQSVMKIYPFSFSSHPKSTENLWKIDIFLFARFLPSPFPVLFYPLTPSFYASKKDLKHFRTLSPYSSLFLPAIFRGIFRRFWRGGNQGA